MKQTDVSKRLNDSLFYQSKNILIFLERGELEFRFTVHNIVSVCVAAPNKEAPGSRVIQSGAILDL